MPAGNLLPLINRRAVLSGSGLDDFASRSVRFDNADGGGGLATATYSYGLTHEERCSVARRIAVLWNLSLGVPTEALEAELARQLQKKAAEGADHGG